MKFANWKIAPVVAALVLALAGVAHGQNEGSSQAMQDFVRTVFYAAKSNGSPTPESKAELLEYFSKKEPWRYEYFAGGEIAPSYEREVTHEELTGDFDKKGFWHGFFFKNAHEDNAQGAATFRDVVMNIPAPNWDHAEENGKSVYSAKSLGGFPLPVMDIAWGTEGNTWVIKSFTVIGNPVRP